MNALNQYAKSKDAKNQAERWISMNGKRYHGGGGGTGAIVYMEVKPTIYYQENNGDKNYHEAPIGFRDAFSEVLKARFAELAAEAMARLTATVQADAVKAGEEHSRILADIEAQ